MSVWNAAVDRTPLASALRTAAAAAALAVTALGFGATSTVAQTLLTLSRGPEVLEFTFEQLAALPQVTIETENEFVDGKVAFRGPLVRDVIEHLALGEVEVLRFTGANDYSVEIPTSDFRKFNVILALEADGQRLSRRDKGPLWLMYPISDNAELQDPLYIHRLIWQVIRIESI